MQKQKLTLTSVNLAGHHAPPHGSGTLPLSSTERAYRLAEQIAKREDDVVAAIEMAPAAQEVFTNTLYGYRPVFPLGFQAERHPARFTAVTALFVKRGLTFEQEERSGFPTTYRCVAGRLTLRDGRELSLRVEHVPCAGTELQNVQPYAYTAPAKSGLQFQEKRKRSQLKDAARWMGETADRFAIALGDYNGCPGDTSGLFACQAELDALSFPDMVTDDTWSNGYIARRLDHVFVSPRLRDGAGVTVRLSAAEPGLTDHAIVETELRL